MEDIAVGHTALRPLRPDDIEQAFHTLQVHGQSLESIGDLAADGLAVEAADLLEVGELRDLHAIQPNLPAEPPRTERWGLPIVLDEANVVHSRIEPEGHKTSQVEIQDLGRRRFDQHLKLIVVLQAERVVAITTIGRPSRGLHVGAAPGLGSDGAQERRGMEGAGADWHVVGLQDHASLSRPIALQRENQILEGAGGYADSLVLHPWPVPYGRDAGPVARASICEPPPTGGVGGAWAVPGRCAPGALVSLRRGPASGGGVLPRRGRSKTGHGDQVMHYNSASVLSGAAAAEASH